MAEFLGKEALRESHGSPGFLPRKSAPMHIHTDSSLLKVCRLENPGSRKGYGHRCRVAEHSCVAACAGGSVLGGRAHHSEVGRMEKV